ncbi:hypothetical protein N9A79_00450 [Pirellulales bacterium]|nr:hypothetical protein [Pirellulales bacterium]
MPKLCLGVTSNSLPQDSLVQNSLGISKNQTSHVGHRFDRCPQLHNHTVLVTRTLSQEASAMVRVNRVMVTESIHLSTHYGSYRDLDEKVHRRMPPNNEDRILYHHTAVFSHHTALCTYCTHQQMQYKKIAHLSKKEG